MNKVYEYVTEKIVEKMKKGVVPWQKGWTDTPPINYVTRKPYRGVNVLLLDRGGEYLTFNQVQQLGGKVKKGAKAQMVVFFKPYTKKVTVKDDETGEEIETEKTIPVLRYYYVFHLDDTEGIPSKIETFSHNAIEEAERVIKNYKDRPAVVHDDPSRACYYPVSDVVNVPELKYFKKTEDYYSTLFHELVHSTGHQKRLARFGNSPDEHMFGSESYSKEELVAELGAAILCGHVGIVERTIDNSAAYVDAWIKQLNDDKTLIVHAASRAQKAVDYILGKTEQNEEEPEEE